MKIKTKVLLALAFAAATIITIVISNAGVDDQPSDKQPSYPTSPYVQDDEDFYCYEQTSGDGYSDIICE